MQITLYKLTNLSEFWGKYDNENRFVIVYCGVVGESLIFFRSII